MNYFSTVVVEYAIFSLSMKSKRSNQLKKKNLLKNISGRHIQTSRISVWISTMVTKRWPLDISSLSIHAAMHDGSHDWVLIGGIQNTLTYFIIVTIVEIHRQILDVLKQFCMWISFMKLFRLHYKSDKYYDFQGQCCYNQS